METDKEVISRLKFIGKVQKGEKIVVLVIINKMQKLKCFPYSWHTDEEEEEVTSFRIYGIDEYNKNVCLRISNFTPFIYLELPESIPWTENKAQLLFGDCRDGNGYTDKMFHR